jgi:hypothetical protein
MSNKLQKYLTNNNKDRVFTNKTFNDFRRDLLNYANEFYSENIIDFSETGLGGLFLDFAAIVGDSLVYYAEQQFNEMDYETATDPENIARFLKRAGINSIKASPSSVEITLKIKVKSNSKDEILEMEKLPVIHANSEFKASNGVYFVLSEDVDFRKDYIVQEISANGSFYIFTIYKKAMCTSGRINTESFEFGVDEGKFLKFELENEEITKIISVYDNENNEYYNVDYLSQDFVFAKVENKDQNEDYLSIKPVPYRFIVEEDFNTNKTTLRFGNGDNTSFSNQIVPDTLDLLLPIKNKDYVSNKSTSPRSILSSNMLGISPAGKNITVEYKYGGGKRHNVSENSITKIENLIITFPDILSLDSSQNDLDFITSSVSINNDDRATGGADVPSFQEIQMHLKNANKMQSRIVTHEDLLTKLTMFPTDFGKVYKAAALNNENFTGIKDIFIVCKNSEDYLENATDALKMNLSKFINENRLIGDNFNIIDSPIFNFGLTFKIKIKKGFGETIRFQLRNDILEYMMFDSFDIGQGIDVNKLTKIIESNPGVVTIVTLKNNIVNSKSAKDNMFDFNSGQSFSYTNNSFNPVTRYDEGIILPPRGGIFELKNPRKDIEILISN